MVPVQSHITFRDQNVSQKSLCDFIGVMNVADRRLKCPNSCDVFVVCRVLSETRLDIHFGLMKLGSERTHSGQKGYFSVSR